MSEHPILFSAPMVRAILDGHKTETRRVVSSLRGFGQITEFQRSDTQGYDWTFRNKKMLWNDIRHDRLSEACPYGVVGDRLWVRETFALSVVDPEGGCPEDEPENYDVIYRADPDQPGGWTNANGEDISPPWKPSIHMPRWASRIELEVISVRVERLQDISEDDARAEGAPGYEEGIDAPPPDERCEWSYRASFRRLWESINGPDSWDANPWVWVVEFRRICHAD